MTVVALGTSQPQCVSPQGPIQGVSVSSQRKGEVDSINKTCSISVRVCVCETESNTDLLPPFESIAFRSVPSVRDSCSKTLREGLQHHPACKTERKRSMFDYWYDCLFHNASYQDENFQYCKWDTTFIMTFVSCERHREDKLNLLT